MSNDDDTKAATFTEAPAERAAQQWHDEHHGSGEPAFSSCWCCCTECDPDYEGDNPNPLYLAAVQRLFPE